MPIDLTKLSDKELIAYKKRIEFDISKYNNIQIARKTQLNSCYGSLGNNYSRWFDIRLAEAITKSGQLVIRWLENHINLYINTLLKTQNVDYVIASDTDSLIITLEKLVDKFFTEEKQKNVDKIITFIDKTCEDCLQPVIDKSCKELSNYLNAPFDALKMKREVLADRAIWVTKKRYVMNVCDKENVRYQTPKLKIMGIEAIRTSTPTICRQKIKDCIKIILSGTEKDLQKYVSEFRKEFKKAAPDEVAFPRTVNGLIKYRSDTTVYIKGSPIHVKGALLYNHLLKSKKVLNKYELIKEGEKIKFLYLKEPNILNDTVIAFINVLPEEFDLRLFVDYDMQFQKTFIEPMTLILNIVGWKAIKEKNLNAFFLD